MIAAQEVALMPEQGPGAMVVQSETATVLSIIERVAMNPDADIEKMERLMAMHERVKAQQAAQLYAAAMKRAQATMPAITKDRQNTQTRSMYATLEAINEKAVPAYTDAGFSLSFNTYQAAEEGCVGVTCKVMHEAGHSEIFQCEVPIDNKGPNGTINKTLTHARASSISYGQRYLVKLIFNLNLGGEDDDGNGGTGDGYGDGQQTNRQTGQQQSKQFYSEDSFKKNFQSWATKIQDGNNTAERIIALVESKGLPLTDKQKSAILNVKGPKK